MFRTTHETRKRIAFSILWLLFMGLLTLLFANIAKYLDETHTKPITCYDVLAGGYIDHRDEYYLIVSLDNQDPFTVYSQNPLIRYYVEQLKGTKEPKLAFALWGDLSNPTVWYIRDLTTCTKLHEPSAGS